MAKNQEDPKPVTPENNFGKNVGRKAERKVRAKKGKNPPTWFWLGMFGLVGWSVAIPTLIGVTLGIWIDATWPTTVSWTLNLLIVGIIIGCLNAWYWVKQESRRNGD
ncbi:AtpZ/AtpI family protein [Nitrosococcus wardiae]|uniref:ATPase F0F1 n=1 Tax=Nitrosococcus wardiae TaxID=1814290 RepID=A0A4P7C1I4_9GAMM|nr:AtpZ/AtpI family protein [Nitrosococcus wardiae]QBQ55487.1 ATPase F0F1 [Nitrosococcus wardiae]